METIQIKAPQNPDDDSFTWTRCIETPSPTAKSAFFYVQEAGMLKMSAEQVSERQNMHSYLIVCVLSGEGYFTFRGKRTMPLPVPVSSLTAWNPTRTKAPETSHGSLYGCILTELPQSNIINISQRIFRIYSIRSALTGSEIFFARSY